MLSEKTWDSRIEKLIEISQKDKVYSDEYGRIMIKSFCNRVKMALDMDLNDIPKLEQTPVTLVRPSEFSVLEIEEAYGLAMYSSQKIEIRFIEGTNHSTLLDSPGLCDLICKSL